MKKHLLLASLFAMPTVMYSQIFQEDWDGNGPGISAWTVLDVDGRTVASNVSALFPNAWNIITPQQWSSLTSGNAAASTSWYTPAGAANDWLISPSVSITGSNPTLVWQAMAQDPNYRDGYKVMIAPNGGNTVADFTETAFTIAAENGATFTERTIDLSAYAGTSIRFAFVNQSNDMFAIVVDNIKIVNDYTPPVLPVCITLTTPTDNETNVSIDNNSFTWSASNENILGYNFYLGDSPTTLTKLGSTVDTTVSITGLDYTSTYYWAVRPYTVAGEAENCDIYSFKTEESVYAPYCGPLKFSSEFFGFIFDGTEPITKVTFAGIDNTSDSAAETETPHENFISQKASVKRGETHTIKLQGNTNGDYISRFAVFIDWNANGTFESTESYEVTDALENSTGTDGKEVSLSITVPNDAVIGDTRMRVKKIYDDEDLDYANLLDACIGASYGQAEDYTVNIAADQPTYCEVKMDCTDADMITKVVFAGINNSSTCSPNGYGDYTATAPAEVLAGESYPMSVTVGTGWYERVTAWIDYNNNGVFESNEEFLGEIGNGGNGVTTTGNVTIPTTVQTGTYRMRLFAHAAGATGTGNTDPCINNLADYGEYEDYMVKVTNNLAVNDINMVKVQAYPNPVVDVLKVSTGANAKSIEVYDLSGKLVISQSAKATANEVNMSKLKTGSYVVKVNTENGAETVKVIKK